MSSAFIGVKFEALKLVCEKMSHLSTVTSAENVGSMACSAISAIVVHFKGISESLSWLSPGSMEATATDAVTERSRGSTGVYPDIEGTIGFSVVVISYIDVLGSCHS
jgi:hypothetical protein